MVTLINEFSASDGDIFPYRFKSLGLGKLIANGLGRRTGIRESLPLVDGGQFSNRSSRFTPKTANNGSSKVTELILISSLIMILGKNLRAKINSSTAPSRKCRTS